MTGDILIIGGPTASGKSAVAVAAVRWLEAHGRQGVILNADALQLYRDLQVLTARPDAAEEAAVPHRLYGVLDGAERGSVARWLGLVKTGIVSALESGAVPVVVGGTGMYLHALRHGLASVPEIPSEIRAEAEGLYRTEGGARFRAALALLDPMSAERLKEGDTQRLIRAYEVVKATGRPLPEWQKEVVDRPLPHWRFHPFVIVPPRTVLYANCHQRFDKMMQQGALEEVRHLLARQLDPSLPVMKAVGVPELAAHLRGEISETEAVRRATQATRHYAKRQLTWLRHRMTDAPILDPCPTCEAKAVEHVAHTLCHTVFSGKRAVS